MRGGIVRSLGVGFAAILMAACGGAGVVTLPPGGQIFVADTSNNRIVRINDMTGAGWTTLGAIGSGTNQFARPFGISGQ
jgi:hypothetical protein